MNFAAQDRVYELANRVRQLKAGADQAIDDYEMHTRTCSFCLDGSATGKQCALADSLADLMRQALTAHVAAIEAWREAKYGSEVK